MSHVFSRALVQDILAGAQAAPDAARTGLICGPDFQQGRVQWLPPEALADALQTRTDALATLVTHPDSPPEPSAAESALPRPSSGLLLIASLQTRGVLEMRAFNRDAADAAGVPITLF